MVSRNTATPHDVVSRGAENVLLYEQNLPVLPPNRRKERNMFEMY